MTGKAWEAGGPLTSASVSAQNLDRYYVELEPEAPHTDPTSSVVATESAYGSALRGGIFDELMSSRHELP